MMAGRCRSGGPGPAPRRRRPGKQRRQVLLRGEDPGIDPPEDLRFLGRRRIVQHILEHEAVHLRLRQLVRALLLDRVLGCQHQERRGQFVLLPPMEVCRSCIASSMALWVLALERLISSSRTMLACTGPSCVTKVPLAAS